MRIICKSKSHKICESQSIKFFNLLKKECNDFMIGPLPCPIEKISNYFRYHIIIKIPHKKLRLILSKIHDIMNNQNILISKNSKILIDMDSNSVL